MFNFNHLVSNLKETWKLLKWSFFIASPTVALVAKQTHSMMQPPHLTVCTLCLDLTNRLLVTETKKLNICLADQQHWFQHHLVLKYSWVLVESVFDPYPFLFSPDCDILGQMVETRTEKLDSCREVELLKNTISHFLYKIRFPILVDFFPLTFTPKKITHHRKYL